MYTSEEIAKVVSDLYLEYGEGVLRLCLRYCNYNNETAEDAVQFTFLRLYETLMLPPEKRKEIKHMRNWLLTVGRNYTIREMEKQQREAASADITEYKDAYDQEIGADESCFRSLNESLLNDAFKVLKAKDEVWCYIIEQIYIYNRSQVDIAKELGMSTNAMYSRLRNIRAWTSKHMGIYLDDMI